MSEKHVGLIVEDDSDAAAEMIDLLGALGHDHVHVDNREDAARAVADREICFVLADLQIKGTKDSAQPRVEAGQSLIDDVRRLFPGRHRGRSHALPILVTSGHAKGPLDVARSFRDGCDDFIVKPFSENALSFREQIAIALRNAGRERHESCPAASCEARAAADSVSLALTGRERAGRSEVVVASRSSLLANTSFLLLVRLVAAACRAGSDPEARWVSLGEFATDERLARKRVSRLKSDVAVLFPAEIQAVENDRGGRYRLSPAVAIANVDWKRLAAHSEASVQKIARSVPAR